MNTLMSHWVPVEGGGVLPRAVLPILRDSDRS